MSDTPVYITKFVTENTTLIAEGLDEFLQMVKRGVPIKTAAPLLVTSLLEGLDDVLGEQNAEQPD